MEQVSVRMPEAMRERLEAEAEEKEMGLAEYIRHELRTDDDELRERVGDLEERVADLEEQLGEREVARVHSRRDSEEIVADLEEDVDDDRPPEDHGDAGTVEEVLADWPPNNQKHRERRREVATAAVYWLRSRDEPASGSDFKSALFDEYPVAEQSPDTWWRKSVRPALKKCVEAGLLEYREGHHDYQWAGETETAG